MPGRVYPTVAEAKEFHKQLIDEFGGIHGLLDEGRLEAAVLRPQTGYYTTLVEEAAAHFLRPVNPALFAEAEKVARAFVRSEAQVVQPEHHHARRAVRALERG